MLRQRHFDLKSGVRTFPAICTKVCCADFPDLKTATEQVVAGEVHYNNNGNLFDQVLINRPLLDAKKDNCFKFVDGSAGLFAFPAMVSDKTGERPRPFGLPKGDAAENVEKTGFSDHFPIVLKVKRV